MDQLWGSMAQYHTVQWEWPVALYLFLAGLSAGALIAALLVKWKDGMGGSHDGLVKAGALLAPITIMIGQGLLIVDLSKPLSFWLLMLHYQLHSIMSIGVILLMIYSGLSTLFAVIVYKDWLADCEWTEWLCKPLMPLIEWFENRGAWLEWLMGLMAIAIAVYTGFLLSALGAKPLLNVPLLPLLFLISGLSAGVGASIALGVTLFDESVAEVNLHYLLSLDTKLLPVELFVLFIMFSGLLNMGGQYAVVARQAISTGVWASVFWVGVVGIGLILPIIVSLTSLHGKRMAVSHSAGLTAGGAGFSEVRTAIPQGTLLINCTLVLLGSALLRLYIVYAGQIFI
ncbi:NrfD/PsrC family molybdoenzyme membrane anchor subunit [Sporomusa acidovorans]|uniref:Polysulfide reductase, NrfD n=1 Tax=Sporomusa acidovorans (strain ATCC 49682 / DSM 3132 / Mol) TaxID=1123286 RepID=A0ABZ3J5I1_SPOA4|nr:NrfD/PsrC family molybdoenzyme membrane anchor subunit [Sporomusa acidovorans]OZC24263.1 polysulfide reductase, NrfD [Sporomusa acidovorans DSM 3132]SDF03658.1 polysulfide reductase chain C [Sporomusa acidovorans]